MPKILDLKGFPSVGWEEALKLRENEEEEARRRAEQEDAEAGLSDWEMRSDHEGLNVEKATKRDCKSLFDL